MRTLLLAGLLLTLLHGNRSLHAQEQRFDRVKSLIRRLVDGGEISVEMRSWGPEQTLGPPNTPGAGDIETAWASRTQDGQDEWLELEYAVPIEPTEVIVHETYNPGAVYKVSGYSKSGMEAELWSGEDPTETTKPRGISKLKIDVKYKTKLIRIHLRSKEVPGWNEIDAVGIKDADGNVQWAIRAKASSSYASTEEPDEPKIVLRTE